MSQVESRFASVILLSVLGLLVWATPAPAALNHPTLSASFGSDGTAGTSFGESRQIAFDQANDRLYVLSSSPPRIHGFDTSTPGTRTPLSPTFPLTVASTGEGSLSDIAVDNSGLGSAGNIIFATNQGNQVYSFNSAGLLQPGFPFELNSGGSNYLTGAGVDLSGNIWVGNFYPQALEKFSPSGAYLESISAAGAGSGYPGHTAFDTASNLYVANYFSNTWKYTPAGSYATRTQLDSPTARDVEVDHATNTIYVLRENSVAAYDQAGNLLEVFATEISSNFYGIAVDEATGTVYVSDGSAGKVHVFPGADVPKATTGDPTGNTEVSGTADPDGAGDITQCFFQYGTSTSYGNTAPCTESLPITGTQTVHATLPVAGEQTYHYRLVLENVNGPARGGDRTITPHNVKVLKTEPATEVNRASVRMNASFEGTNEETTYFFEYGKTTSYGSRFPLAPTELVQGPTTGPTGISTLVTGLTPDTTYHYRVIAENSFGSSPGNDVQFHTPVAVKDVVTEDATDVTKTTATLNGSYDGATNDTPPGPLEDFHYYFEWGKTTTYGQKTAAPPGVSAGAHAETVHVSAPISGLTATLPDTLPYHYRLVVTNGTGTTYGPDHTFLPDPPDLPQVSDASAGGISPTGATLSATINPGEGETVYLFEYGPDASYGSTTPLSDPLEGDTDDHPVSATLNQLQPGSTYHYRVVAFNFTGTAKSADQTFTTPDAPVIESSGSSGIGQTTAHLTATVIANASATSVHFEYGTGSSFGAVTAPAFAGADLFSQPVGADLSGLTPGTTYHFRAVAVNGIGTTYGADSTFTTSAPPSAAPAPKPKCRKGFVKRRGKCVKKPRRKRSNRRGDRNA